MVFKEAEKKWFYYEKLFKIGPFRTKREAEKAEKDFLKSLN